MPYMTDANGNYVPVASTKGEDGKEVELRVNAGYIQWRREDTEWANLIAVESLRGEPGKKVQLSASGYIIKWKYEDDTTWTELCDFTNFFTSISAAESARVNAESARASAESARATSETARANAETSRQNAEQSRSVAEANRASAEQDRQNQESARQANTDAAIQDANDATDRANTAAEACEDIAMGAIPSHAATHATGGKDAISPTSIGAAAASHTHTISGVTGLQKALDGKQAAGDYAAANHTHAPASIGAQEKISVSGILKGTGSSVGAASPNVDYVSPNGNTNFTSTAPSTSTATGAITIAGGLGVAGHIYADKVHGATWNDYAEYRSVYGEVSPGDVAVEFADDKIAKSNRRADRCGMVVSDTFGFCIGKELDSDVPVAVAGRVLVNTERNRLEYHVGDVLCTGRDGKAAKMRWYERLLFPHRAIGIVSSIPSYKTWNGVEVHGRIWMKVI